MKQHAINFICWTLIVVLVIAFATVVYAYGIDAEKNIKGRWVKDGIAEQDCYCGECLDIDFKDEKAFCVESNQIYVKAFYRYNRKQKELNLYFSEVAEVGLGGAALPWDDFDKEKPLATMDVSEAQMDKIIVKWLGFQSKADRNRKFPFGDAYTGTYHRSKRNTRDMSSNPP